MNPTLDGIFSRLVQNYALFEDLESKRNGLVQRLISGRNRDQSRIEENAERVIKALVARVTKDIKRIELEQSWKLKELEVKKREAIQALVECEDELRLLCLDNNSDHSKSLDYSILDQSFQNMDVLKALSQIKVELKKHQG